MRTSWSSRLMRSTSLRCWNTSRTRAPAPFARFSAQRATRSVRPGYNACLARRRTDGHSARVRGLRPARGQDDGGDRCRGPATRPRRLLLSALRQPWHRPASTRIHSEAGIRRADPHRAIASTRRGAAEGGQHPHRRLVAASTRGICRMRVDPRSHEAPRRGPSRISARP